MSKALNFSRIRQGKLAAGYQIIKPRLPPHCGTVFNFNESMFICATVIYFGETPKGYDFIREEKGYHLKPPETGEEGSPHLVVTPSAYGWQIDGTTDAAVKQQVLKLIELHPLIDLPDTWSAAS